MRKQFVSLFAGSAVLMAAALPQFAFAFGGSKPTPLPTSTPAPGEPSYCVYSNLSKKEIPYARKGLERQHLYQFGGVTLAGLAVGNSDAEATRAMSQDFSGVTAQKNFCTWYFNSGNDDAEEWFSHYHVDRPGSDPAKAAAYYRSKLSGIFASNPINIVSCARDEGYVALGCDGQRHRGPTVFGMLLAYSGCRPEHAAEIVNYVWGLNGVPEASRLAVIREGYKMGQENPEASATLRALFSQ